MPIAFVQVDVFTTQPLYGNPAAVVFDGDHLSTDTMQRIAREMNLSETVFIVSPTTPGADYRARIFTPMSELPFAGHPTIAAAHAVLDRFADKASATLLRQECGIGLVPVEVLQDGADRVLRMTQASPTYRGTDLARASVAQMLGCAESDVASTPFEVVSTGVPWLIVQLARRESISELVPDQALIQRECRRLRAAGITTFVERGPGGPARIRVRTFAPGEGVAEDPVCGSGNGSVAAYIARHTHPDEVSGSYVSEQGIEIGRDGLVRASWEHLDGHIRIRIGGSAVIVARGELLL